MHPLNIDRSRAALLAHLAEPQPWDVLVIGGGATGLACAWDAALRGDRVLLVEAHDFAQGTSSRSTKLIHGGVRYLEQGNIALVREALEERARLLRNAPRLVSAQRFIAPVYGWFEKARLAAGLKLYDALAGRHGIAPTEVLDVAATRAALPTLADQGLAGAVAYWDARFDDTRLALAMLDSLFAAGGVALNYCAVEALLQEGGRVRGATLVERESGRRIDVGARVVINATGVWSDHVRQMAVPGVAPLLRPSQGAHIVLDGDFLPGGDALLVPRTRDGRVLFMIPWHGRLLVGTTDTERSDAPLEPQARADEIDFILETAARYLHRVPTRADVRSTFAGLRPLLGAPGGATSRLSREHHIETAHGLVSILGGKWTTVRRMAEETVDTARHVAGLAPRRSRTAVTALADSHGWPGRADEALDVPDDDQVEQAARHGLARSVEDILARRYRTLFIDAAAAWQHTPRIARRLAQVLDHDEAWQQTQLEAMDERTRQYGRRE